jgi:hypothetical protein
MTPAIKVMIPKTITATRSGRWGKMMMILKKYWPFNWLWSIDVPGVDSRVLTTQQTSTLEQ